MNRETEERSSIQVAIKVRPMLDREMKEGEFETIRAEDNLIIVFDPMDLELDKQNRQVLEIYHRSREQRYAFDNVFTKESSEKMYYRTAHNLIDPLFKGFNGCVFAYGATGSGKTYTMLGYGTTVGLNALALREIFEKRNEMPDFSVEVLISYVEIYNEQIRDLLVSKDTASCELRDDPIRGVTLTGATESKAESVEEVMTLLHSGNKRRTTESTNANFTSSRSHAVFQVTLISTPKSKDVIVSKTIGKLSMIDLAGSERGTVTENRGIRLREGAKINQSLLALANCINALGDRSKKGSFVPFRDSKLTRMLKDSLGGNCRTVMVVTVSPSSSQFEETLNTLKYASRAKCITTKPVENKKLVEFHIAEYKNIIAELRDEIETLRLKINPDLKNEAECSCKASREHDAREAELIKAQLVDNFKDRVQLRRGLCELEAQNQLNNMKIRKGQEKLMRHTLSRPGKLVAKSCSEDSLLPSQIRNELTDIKQLSNSVSCNEAYKKQMIEELEQKTQQAKQVIDSLTSKIEHADQRQYLELMIKNQVVEVENDELEYNLRMQEKLNKILADELKRIRRICTRNSIIISEGESEGESEDEDTALTQPLTVRTNNISRRRNHLKSIDLFNSDKKRKETEILPKIEEKLYNIKSENSNQVSKFKVKEIFENMEYNMFKFTDLPRDLKFKNDETRRMISKVHKFPKLVSRMSNNKK